MLLLTKKLESHYCLGLSNEALCIHAANWLRICQLSKLDSCKKSGILGLRLGSFMLVHSLLVWVRNFSGLPNLSARTFKATLI